MDDPDRRAALAIPQVNPVSAVCVEPEFGNTSSPNSQFIFTPPLNYSRKADQSKRLHHLSLSGEMSFTPRFEDGAPILQENAVASGLSAVSPSMNQLMPYVENNGHQYQVDMKPMSNLSPSLHMNSKIQFFMKTPAWDESGLSVNSTETSFRLKRKKAHKNDGCKRCNCKKTHCLKLYCDCFAAGEYCSDSCACRDCYNRAEYEDTVSESRENIVSRNPHAFAPKVVLPKESEDSIYVTPTAGRHKRGCNCKKSLCLKKYCECFLAHVGCSSGCRCEGCSNTFGRKEGHGKITEMEQEKVIENHPCGGELETMESSRQKSSEEYHTQFSKQIPLSSLSNFDGSGNDALEYTSPISCFYESPVSCPSVLPINFESRTLMDSFYSDQYFGGPGNDAHEYILPPSFYGSPGSCPPLQLHVEESSTCAMDSIRNNMFAKAREKIQAPIPYDLSQCLNTYEEGTSSHTHTEFTDTYSFQPCLSHVGNTYASAVTETIDSNVLQPNVLQGSNRYDPLYWSPITPLQQFDEEKLIPELYLRRRLNNNLETDTSAVPKYIPQSVPLPPPSSYSP